jgi:hypothetical protein
VGEAGVRLLPSSQHKEESVEEIKGGGVTKIRSSYIKMTDVNFASILQRIEMLEETVKEHSAQLNQIRERFEAAKSVLKKDKEK